MYDHQSQAPPTHHKPFDKWLKEALRLNRDPVLFCAHDGYQELEGGFLVTAALKLLWSGRLYIVSSTRLV
jgi:hypothetical protein